MQLGWRGRRERQKQSVGRLESCTASGRQRQETGGEEGRRVNEGSERVRASKDGLGGPGWRRLGGQSERSVSLGDGDE